jgi:dienelactone hydrolase
MAMRIVLLFTLPLAAAGFAHASEEHLSAALNESVFKLPTTVKDAYGDTITGEMTITQFKPNGAGPFPIAILMHGRGLQRDDVARFRYQSAAAYLVRRGFAVWLPTRLGYGDSGLTPDPEYSGACNRKMYSPVYEVSAQSARDVIAYASKQPFADPARVIVIGQSFGGTTAIALAAKPPPGLLATVNFAGGGGGNPDTRPGAPCRPDLLEAMFGGYGATARIPTLWVYTANDRWMGATAPKRWFAAYAKAGGTGQFAAMPPFGEDGHSLFGKGFPVWRPLVDRFLASVGFAAPVSGDAPPATAFAQLDDVEKVPVTSTEAREKYKRFLQLDVPRAYAIGPRGEFGYYSAPDAAARALAGCAKRAGVPCKLYAVDDQVVWKE